MINLDFEYIDGIKALREYTTLTFGQSLSLKKSKDVIDELREDQRAEKDRLEREKKNREEKLEKLKESIGNSNLDDINEVLKHYGIKPTTYL